MRRKLLAAVFAGGLLAGAVLPATVLANDVTVTPGDPGCHGQVVAEQAVFHRGLKHAADDHGVTIQDGQTLIRAFCAGG
jgi:hypothetical protein